MEITRAWIHAHASPRGGFTRAQLAAIGVDWPPARGWVQRCEGRTVTPEARAVFENRAPARDALTVATAGPMVISPSITMTTTRRSVIARLDPAQLEALQRIRSAEGVPVSEQIRRGVDLWLASAAARNVGVVVKDKAAPRRVSPRRKA